MYFYITFKVAAIYRLASSAIAIGEVASLDHKVLYNSMKGGAFITEFFSRGCASAFFTSAQTEKVFACLGTYI